MSIAPQIHDGFALPFRIELRTEEGGAYAIIIDARHRPVPFPGETFDDMMRYVHRANGMMHEAWCPRSKTPAIWLTVPERLALGHPVARKPAIIATALECLIVGGLTDWIDDAMRDLLRLYEVVDANSKPTPRVVEQWTRWRLAENAALAKRKML